MNIKPKDYKVGGRCCANHIVASILGQSDKVVVYTTKDNHLRWHYGGEFPKKLLPARLRFDQLMTAIRLALPKAKRKPVYHLLGKCLFQVLHTGDPKTATCFESVEKFLPSEARTRPDNGAKAHIRTSRKVFLVHGHDDGVKQTVARFLEHLKLKPIILHEQAQQGRAIIEKFEEHSDVGFAVVLLTPDDVGATEKQRKTLKPRARQNVIFEMGFFMAHLGRHRVHALCKGGVEIPSDVHGIVYTKMDQGGAWKIALTKELKKAGIKLSLADAV